MGLKVIASLGLILIAVILLMYRFVQKTDKDDRIIDIISNLLSPSTIFAMLIYLTFCYLSIKGKLSPNSIENAFLIIVAFYFGFKSSEKNGTNGKGGGDEKKTS